MQKRISTVEDCIRGDQETEVLPSDRGGEGLEGVASADFFVRLSVGSLLGKRPLEMPRAQKANPRGTRLVVLIKTQNKFIVLSEVRLAGRKEQEPSPEATLHPPDGSVMPATVARLELNFGAGVGQK